MADCVKKKGGEKEKTKGEGGGGVREWGEGGW